MPRFLAVYTMRHEDFERFRAMPKAEQDAVDTLGVQQWAAWEERHAGSILDRGGMVGKTMRVNRDEIAPATNTLCGYLVVEAETIGDAARIFETHPHITTFPGDGIDIMPIVTDPAP